MIRDAVLHLFNEQPLVADLYRLPDVGDLGLLCTNLRQLNGTRPVFVDDLRSTFFFPYAQIRFVEIPPASIAAAGVVPGMPSSDVRPAGASAARATDAGSGTRDLAPDAGSGVPGLPAGREERADEASSQRAPDQGIGGQGPETVAAEPAGREPEPDLELDETILRRIREI